MIRKPALPCWACLVVIFPLGAGGLHASDTPAPEPGYHNVTVQSGGKPMVIQVKDSIGPRLQGASPVAADGKYDPENMDLGRSSSFANKSFSSSNSALGKSDTALEAQGDNQFQTKPFAAVSPDSSANFGRTYPTRSFGSSARSQDEFQKTFATSGSSLTQGKDLSFATQTSDLQGRTAALGGPTKAPFSGLSNLNDKTFSDPNLTHIKRDPYASANNLDVSRLVDLPNRPLTIDEVRNLINHETIPNLNEKPDAPSKALNDPAYEPPAALPPARDDNVPPGPEEKDSGLPSPGEMAQPNAAGALPK